MLFQMACVFLVHTLIAQTTPAIPSDEPQADGRRTPGRDAGERREARRQRMEGYLRATPAERRERRLDGLTEMIARTYELTDQQKPEVAAELRRMRAEYDQQLGPAAVEMQQIEEEMARFWQRRAEAGNDGPRGQAWRDPEFRRLAERMRELRREHPFDVNAAFERIEKLLPAEQAAKGRARRIERQERMQQWRSGGGRRGEGPVEPRRGERRGRRTQAENNAESTPSPAPTPVAAEPWRHPWELYAEQYAARHDLSAEQRAAAAAIVRDLIARERSYRASRRHDFEAMEQIASPAERNARRTELETPIDALFQELNQRLDDVLTAAQRSKR